MSLNVRPILSALLRNRTGAILVAMQVAIALAVYNPAAASSAIITVILRTN